MKYIPHTPQFRQPVAAPQHRLSHDSMQRQPLPSASTPVRYAGRYYTYVICMYIVLLFISIYQLQLR